MLVTLTEIHNQLNLDTEFVEDDTYLTLLEESAELAVANHIDRGDLSQFVDESGECDKVIKLCILMLVATWYNTRESVTFGNAKAMPHSLDYLLNQYAKYTA